MTVVWTPSQDQILNSNLKRFENFVSRKLGKEFKSYQELHEFSISTPEFWRLLIEFCEVIGDWQGPVYEGGNIITAKWFPQSKLNFAENMLKNRSQDTALVFRCENRIFENITFTELYDQVSKVAQYLRALGVKKGDRVAGFLPNFIGLYAIFSVA